MLHLAAGSGMKETEPMSGMLFESPVLNLRVEQKPVDAGRACAILDLPKEGKDSWLCCDEENQLAE